MQGQYSLFRGTILIASGAVTTIALGLLVYRHFKLNEGQTQTETKLHRRNAVRRRRRRWRRGFQPIDLDYDPLTQALKHLKEREESGIGYGLYTNHYYVTTDLLNTRRDDFQLLPSKLEQIHAFIAQRSDLSPTATIQLALHIHSAFLGNFLTEEYPQGYLVDGDIDELVRTLRPFMSPHTIQKCVEAFDQDGRTIHMDYECPGSANIVEQSHGPDGGLLSGELTQALSPSDLRDRLAEASQWTDEDGGQPQGQNVLDLLYRIGEEQAKRSGYQHRGVECNGCSMQPIRGIRYHCANCWDYDLCEACESQQVHHKTHVFYKIRIPAPTRGQIKLIQPVWYPGNPNACPESIPTELKDALLEDTELDRQDLDALYDQFKCIAGHPLNDDSYSIGMAIDKPCFHRYFSTTTADRPSKPNLIHDRIFVFYDRDGDGLITFYDFAKGMAELMHNTTRHARIERAFRAFDLDSDGYLERKDFIRMLRAHYALNKELSEEIIFAREDTILADDEIREVIRGSNPISAAFGGSSFAGHQSRHGHGKHLNDIGDMVMNDVYESILGDDSELLGDRTEAIARHASGGRALLRRSNPEHNRAQADDPIIPLSHVYGMSDDHSEPDINGILERAREDVDNLHQPSRWPRDDTHVSDVRQALGTDVALHDVLDPLDRQRVLFAQDQRRFQQKETEFNGKEQDAIRRRWQMKDFYMDEHEGLQNPGIESLGIEDDEAAEYIAHLTNMSNSSMLRRSRSSSRVRFDESMIDADDGDQGEVSSRISSKSNTPINERWGGFEFATADREIGRELIYEAVQEAFLEMLDYFFRDIEERAVRSLHTRPARAKYASEIRKYADSLKLDGATPEEKIAHQEKINMEMQRVGDEYDQRDLLRMAFRGTAKGVVPSDKTKNDPQPDPTLPQNRPNEVSDTKRSEAEAETTYQVFDQSYLVNPRDLPLWHEHNLLDQEARERGGYGKLSLEEFKQKLRADVNGEGEGEEEFWETRADLGRFSFLSTWLEMASF